MPVARLERERSQRIDAPYPGGESYRDCVERMRDFLDDLWAEYDGQRVLLIGHAATRWSLQHLLEGIPLEELVDAPFEWQEGWEFVLRR